MARRHSLVTQLVARAAVRGVTPMRTTTRAYLRIYSPTLLSKAAVDELFAPQFEEGSSALAGLEANSEYTFKATLDNSLDSVTMNYGLGGLVVTEDVVRDDYLRPKGTLSWSGLPALLWGINREKGLAFFWATQVVPWADRRSFEVAARFETAVWRNLKA
jgi:hypothetical protein